MNKKILLAFSVIFFALTISVKGAVVVSMAALPSPTTQIQTSQCGQVLPALNTSIYANVVAGATYYRFKVSTTLPDNSVQVQTVVNVLRVFNLTQLSTFYFARTYTVEVAVYVGGVWQPYGPACTVISPTSTTSVQSAQCGITMVSVSDQIYANLVPYAPGYRFRLTNVATAQVHIVDRPVRDLRLNLFPVVSGATYNVDVAVKNYDGTYLPYGPVCAITAPVMFTKIQASYCGRVLTAFSEYIYADHVQGATGYRFKFTNMANLSDVQYLDRPLREFTMAMLTNVQYNAAYKIEVSVKDSNGTYLPYGPFCTVFSPVLPVPKIQLSQCEMICSNTTELMYADEYPNATVYRFRLQNFQSGYSQYIDRTVRSYNLSMFTGLQANTAYTVKVAVKIYGVFTGYGKACDVTTPAIMPATRMALGFDGITDNDNIENDTPFMPKLYPNPFSEYFSIDASLQAAAEVSVKVYDMMGRLLDSNRIAASELQSLQLGTKYPPGVYNVVMQCNDEVKTLHVIKR